MRKKSHPFFFLISPSVVAAHLPIFKSGGRLQNGFDLDTLFDFGIYSFTVGDTVNNASSAASVLIVYGYSSNRVIQVQLTMGGSIHARFYTGDWSEWTNV